MAVKYPVIIHLFAISAYVSHARVHQVIPSYTSVATSEKTLFVDFIYIQN